MDPPNRDEIERNRRKVMEINFFLDNQQIDFDNLTAGMTIDVAPEKPSDQSEDEKLVEALDENEAKDWIVVSLEWQDLEWSIKLFVFGLCDIKSNAISCRIDHTCTHTHMQLGSLEY